MDISTELGSISLSLFSLANDIEFRHINRAAAAEMVKSLGHSLMELKSNIDRSSGEFGQAYAEGLDSTTFDADCTAPDDNCICMKCNTGHEYHVDGTSFRMTSSEPDILFTGDTISNRLSRAFRQSNDYIRHWSNGRWHERGCICTDCIGAASE